MTRTWILRVVVASLGGGLIGCYTSVAQEERPGEPESLAPNAGFEEGVGDQPEAWSFYSWEGSEGWWDGEVFRSGAKSLGLRGINGGWSANVAVEPVSMTESACIAAGAGAFTLDNIEQLRGEYLQAAEWMVGRLRDRRPAQFQHLNMYIKRLLDCGIREGQTVSFASRMQTGARTPRPPPGHRESVFC